MPDPFRPSGRPGERLSGRSLRPGAGKHRARARIPWSVRFGAISVIIAVYLASSVPLTPHPPEPGPVIDDRTVSERPPEPSATPAFNTLPPATTTPPPRLARASPPASPARVRTTSHPSPRSTPNRKASRKPTRPITTPSTATCTYRYTVNSVEDDGKELTVSVTLTNTSASTLTKWNARFSLDQTVALRKSQGARLKHTGNTVRVTPSHEDTLPPGSSVTFEFTATAESPVDELSGFLLAGTHCRQEQ